MTARIQTLDHCGFVVEDIPRAHRFYEDLLGAKPLRTAQRSRFSGPDSNNVPDPAAGCATRPPTLP